MASGVKRTLFKWIKNDYKRGWSRQLCLSRWGLNIDTNVFMSRSVMSYSFATPWTIALQAALSLRFPRQAYWSGLLFPSPWYLPTQGSNLSLLNCRQILYHLRYQGSPCLTLACSWCCRYKVSFDVFPPIFGKVWEELILVL